MTGAASAADADSPVMSHYCILSVDGGGIRGLLSVVMLQQLDRRLPGWRSRVDFHAGTSSGGLIALGLAAGRGPEDLRQLFERESQRIFRDSPLDDIVDLGRLVGAQYDNRNLRRVLQTVFGETRLADLPRPVLVPAFDLDNEAQDEHQRCWKPKFFHNFPGSDCDRDALVADVALYTALAPSYFPSADGYIDGGVAAGNPAMAAVTQVLDQRAELDPRPRLDQVSVLSLGTGKVLSRLPGERHDWGLAQWASPLLRLLLDASLGMVDYQCRQLLGDRFRRLNPVFQPGQAIPLDGFDRMDELVRLGEEGMNRELDDTAEWLQRHWL